MTPPPHATAAPIPQHFYANASSPPPAAELQHCSPADRVKRAKRPAAMHARASTRSMLRLEAEVHGVAGQSAADPEEADWLETAEGRAEANRSLARKRQHSPPASPPQKWPRLVARALLPPAAGSVRQAHTPRAAPASGPSTAGRSLDSSMPARAAASTSPARKRSRTAARAPSPSAASPVRQAHQSHAAPASGLALASPDAAGSSMGLEALAQGAAAGRSPARKRQRSPSATPPEKRPRPAAPLTAAALRMAVCEPAPLSQRLAAPAPSSATADPASSRAVRGAAALGAPAAAPAAPTASPRMDPRVPAGMGLREGGEHQAAGAGEEPAAYLLPAKLRRKVARRASAASAEQAAEPVAALPAPPTATAPLKVEFKRSWRAAMVELEQFTALGAQCAQPCSAPALAEAAAPVLPAGGLPHASAAPALEVHCAEPASAPAAAQLAASAPRASTPPATSPAASSAPLAGGVQQLSAASTLAARGAEQTTVPAAAEGADSAPPAGDVALPQRSALSMLAACCAELASAPAGAEAADSAPPAGGLAETSAARSSELAGAPAEAEPAASAPPAGRMIQTSTSSAVAVRGAEPVGAPAAAEGVHSAPPAGGLPEQSAACVLAARGAAQATAPVVAEAEGSEQPMGGRSEPSAARVLAALSAEPATAPAGAGAIMGAQAVGGSPQTQMTSAAAGLGSMQQAPGLLGDAAAAPMASAKLAKGRTYFMLASPARALPQPGQRQRPAGLPAVQRKTPPSPTALTSDKTQAASGASPPQHQARTQTPENPHELKQCYLTTLKDIVVIF